MIGRKHFILFFFLFASSVLYSQITSGKIVYERKTNLYKKFKHWNDVKEWINEEDKTKNDVFELYFTDTSTLFMPQESDIREQMSWATAKNTTYQNFKTKERLSIKIIWGEELYVADTMIKRQWKITDSKRMICGYNCRKAIWQANDTTRIYAWYADEINSSVGPESFNGLPGAILGVASEDGGVIYFAKLIEATKPESEKLILKKGKNKIYTALELKERLEKDFGKRTWGKILINNVFGIW